MFNEDYFFYSSNLFHVFSIFPIVGKFKRIAIKFNAVVTKEINFKRGRRRCRIWPGWGPCPCLWIDFRGFFLVRCLIFVTYQQQQNSLPDFPAFFSFTTPFSWSINRAKEYYFWWCSNLSPHPRFPPFQNCWNIGLQGDFGQLIGPWNISFHVSFSSPLQISPFSKTI